MSELILPRRRFLLGVASLLAAPAVIRVAKLMPVSAQPRLWYVNIWVPNADATGMWEGFVFARTAENVKRALLLNRLPVTAQTTIAPVEKDGACVRVPYSKIYDDRVLTHYEFRPPS